MARSIVAQHLMPRSAANKALARRRLNAARGFDGPVSLIGNRCGHIPGVPRPFKRPAEWRPAPKLTDRFCQLIDKCFFDKKFASSVLRTPLKSPPLLRGIRRGLKRLRSLRSEQLDACNATLKAFAHRLQYLTMRACKPDEENHRMVRGLYLAEISELAQISESQVSEAIKNLQSVGFVGVFPKVHLKANGIYEGRATVYTVFEGLFWALGLKRALGKQRGVEHPSGCSRAEGRKRLFERAQRVWTNRFRRKRRSRSGTDPPAAPA